MDKLGKYDCIVVGTSPLMLIEACFLSKIGKKVVVVEKKTTPGGSWQCFELDSLKAKVEEGCHIWYRSSRCFGFLNQEFDLEIQELDFQPKVYKGNKYYPYYMINFFVLSKEVIRINSFNKMRLFKNISTLFIKDLLSKEKYSYPFYGANDLIEKILIKLKDRGVDLVLGENIVEVNLNQKRIALDNGRIIEFKDEIVATNKSLFSRIVDKKGEVITSDKQLTTVYNFYLIIKGDQGQKVSYVGVWEDDVIYRIADITYNNEILIERDKRVLCIQVYESFYNEHNNNPLNILITKLKAMGIIDSALEIEDYFWRLFEYNNVSNDNNNSLKRKYKPEMRIMNSHNLVKSFAENIDRWKC